MSELTPHSMTRFRVRLREIASGQQLASVLGPLRRATEYHLSYPLLLTALLPPERDGDDSIVVTLPMNREELRFARIVVADHPQVSTRTVLYDAKCGYRVQDEFRVLCPVRYVCVEGKQIVEVGLANEALVALFRRHVFGHAVSADELDRQMDIQESVFAMLRGHEVARRKLEEFIASRGWPRKVVDRSYLAYLGNEVDLQSWAQAQGYTDEEMFHTGWYDRAVKKNGACTYSVRDDNVIRIPYYYKGRILSWRTRTLSPKLASKRKYASFPLDRSLHRPLPISCRLYGAWNLHEAKGKTLIVTEGEFKADVATATGILTVGIPGITQVDNGILRVIAACGAERIIVVLDRDPYGKGLMRVDGITDSQRASYAIAQGIRRAGHRNVLVGVIPDVRQGEKVGLDDLILDQGEQSLHALVEASTTPEEYARAINLEMVFAEIWDARQRLKWALRDYDTSVKRGGKKVADTLYRQARYLFGQVCDLYTEYLQRRFFGAQRIDQPYVKYMVKFRNRRMLGAGQKLVVDRFDQSIPIERFQNDILVLQFVTRDQPLGAVLRFTPQLPWRHRDVARWRMEPEASFLRQVINRGCQVLFGPDASPLELSQDTNLLSQVVLAGMLDRWFPSDEYRIEPDIQCFFLHNDFWEEVVKLPVTVFRRASNEAVVVAFLVLVKPGEEVSPAESLTALNQRVYTFGGFISPTYDREQRTQLVAETLWPYWFERNLPRTIEYLSQLGITEETIRLQRLLLLEPEDAEEVLRHLDFRRQVNQSVIAGLFRRDVETGRVSTRFLGQILLIPKFDEDDQLRSWWILPLEYGDHLPPHLPPSRKVVHELTSTRRKVTQIGRSEYRQTLTIAGKSDRLLLTYHELDALVLAEGNDTVWGLHSEWHLPEGLLEQLQSGRFSEVCLVLSGPLPYSTYDAVNFDGIPGVLREMYDFQSQLAAVDCHVAVQVVHIDTPLSRLVWDDGVDRQAALWALATPLEALLHERKFNAMQHMVLVNFLEKLRILRGYLEFLGYPKLVDGKGIAWWAKHAERLYKALWKFASDRGRVMVNFDDFIAVDFSLVEPVPIAELVRLRADEGKTLIRRPLLTASYEMQLDRLPADFYAPILAVLNGERVSQVAGLRPSTQLLRTIVGGVVPKRAKAVANNQKHPKSRVLEWLQGQDRAADYSVEFEALPAPGHFRALVVIAGDPPVQATAEALGKKQAETDACAQLLLANSGEEAAAQSDVLPASSMDPVSYLFYLHTMQRASTPKVAYEPQLDGSWQVKVSIALLGGKVVAAESTATKKKSAYHQAAETIVQQLAEHFAS